MKRYFDNFWIVAMIALLAIFGWKEVDAGFEESKLNEEFVLRGVETDATLKSYHYVPKPRRQFFASYGDQPILAYEDGSKVVHEHVAAEYGFVTMSEKTALLNKKFKITYLANNPSKARVMSKYVSPAWQMFLAGFLSLLMSAVIAWDLLIRDRLKR